MNADVFLSSLREAVRSCWRTPGYTIAAAMTLVLAITANVVIFSITDTLLIRALPYPESDQLVKIGELNQNRTYKTSESIASYPAFLDIQRQSSVFKSIAAYRDKAFNIEVGGSLQQVDGAIVTGDFFHVMEVPAAVGVTFTDSGNKLGMLISHNLSLRLFGSDSEALGKVVTVEGTPYVVTGVMPGEFAYPTPCDLWVPLNLNLPDHAADVTSRSTRRYSIIARLKHKVGSSEARAEMTVIGKRLEKEYPDSNKGWSIAVTPLRLEILGDARAAILILFGAVGLVLLIACANVGSLSLARTLSRFQEMAIRTALGSPSSRIVVTVLSENLVVAMISFLLGSVMARLAIRGALKLAPTDLPFASNIHMNLRALLFGGLISVVAGILCGVGPAIHLMRTDLNAVLKSGRGHAKRNELRRLLVGAEIAISLALLSGAIFLTKSFINLQRVYPGFQSESMVSFRIVRPFPKNPSPEERFNLWSGFQERLLDQVRVLPGVSEAAATLALPMQGHQFRVNLDLGRQIDPSNKPTAEERIVSSHYLEMMKIPLLQGRYFYDSDGFTATKVAIINEAFADAYFNSENPLGKHVEITAFGIGKAEIVGVVGNVYQASLSEKPNPELYHSYRQVSGPIITLVVHTDEGASDLPRTIARVVSSLDPEQPVPRMRVLENDRADALGYAKFRTVLLILFSGLALFLVIVGVYGLVKYSVDGRTFELGVRMALGATKAGVFWLVIREAGVLAGFGLAAGIPLTLATSLTLRHVVYGTGIFDLSVYSIACLLLALLVLIGTLGPAVKATTTEPTIVLRDA